MFAGNQITLNQVFIEYLDVDRRDACEQMSVPGVSVLFAGDN